MLVRGQLVRLPGETRVVEVDDVVERDGATRVYFTGSDGSPDRRDLTADQLSRTIVLSHDGGGDPRTLLTGLWSEWMRAATIDSAASALATNPLRPYAHQTTAVYDFMLPQPRLRFLLADEPGTGKTIMAGMFIREAQRLGWLQRCLVVAPAHLVPKWQADIQRFFGGRMMRITSGLAQEGPLRPDQDLWIVSLDLLAANPAVQQVTRTDNAGWDLVIFDEAHRLTPSAQSYYRVGRSLSHGCSRVLMLTATPHRGRESLFRALLNLVDPHVFPEPDEADESLGRLKPGSLHFLRRMKEDLFDYDGETPLFQGRNATNRRISLNPTELGFYKESLDLVAEFFPPTARQLAAMVYGKRAASSLYALAETLKRRRKRMGTELPALAVSETDPDYDDEEARNEERVVVEESLSARAEKKALDDVLGRLEKVLAEPDAQVSKWPVIVSDCLGANGIVPGGDLQAVVFTEYADTADWLIKRFHREGFSAERYSGRDLASDREAIREQFARKEFQVLVSTDAGNEGIDLQTAHVLVNWDIPWSLVRLEQRMGRIHRIGQTRDVELFNLVATDTREGEVLSVLLDNFVEAANALNGKVFDSLSLVAELLNVDADHLLTETYDAREGRREAALVAAQAVTSARIRSAAEDVLEEQRSLASPVDMEGAVRSLQRDELERVNPRIVEAYLGHVARSGIYKVVPHAAGRGVFVLSGGSERSLPETFEDSRSALIATGAAAIAEARHSGADVSEAVTLGPGTAEFRSLVALVARRAMVDLFRGAALSDASSVTDYDLFVFEFEISEGPRPRRVTFPCLIRVDATGARGVRWEMLADLEAAPLAPAVLHPARCEDAHAKARFLADERVQRRRDALASWRLKVRNELQRLPAVLSASISDPEARQATRTRVKQAVQRQLEELEEMGRISVDAVKWTGWAHVQATGAEEAQVQKDSERIAMLHVAELLRAEGWKVADVHDEGRGYDLHAINGRYQRCVEVKGIWSSAASVGVDMTGNEVLIAQQLAGDYWLYVVDDCQNGGKLFGRYQDPAAVFGPFMRTVSVVSLPGSALKNALAGGPSA